MLPQPHQACEFKTRGAQRRSHIGAVSVATAKRATTTYPI